MTARFNCIFLPFVALAATASNESVSPLHHVLRQHHPSSVARIRSNLQSQNLGRRPYRNLQDYDIERAIEVAQERYALTNPPLLSSEWIEKATDNHANNRHLQSSSSSNTNTLVGFAISALSPGFDWNVPVLTNQTSYFCAGANLTEDGVRPKDGQHLMLLDCEVALSSERLSSQILIEYVNDGSEGYSGVGSGSLNFFEMSRNDIFSRPKGFCSSVRKVKKNQELLVEYCDETSYEQIWRVLPEDNTWRPNSEWFTVDGDSLCVEVKTENNTNVLSVGNEMHLRPCTFQQEEARERQSWIWCYQDTQCDTALSTPPDFTIEVDCETTRTQLNLQCDASLLTDINTSEGGAIPPDLYNRLDECLDDPIDDKRFGHSLLYRISSNADDQYLRLLLHSTCRSGDANVWLRVYEEQNNGDWDCAYRSNTFCEDGLQSVTAMLDPYPKDVLVILSDDGSGNNQVDLDLELECSSNPFEQIVLVQDGFLCMGSQNAEIGAVVRLYPCNENINDISMLWRIEKRTQLLRLQQDLPGQTSLCAESVGISQDGSSIRLARCDPTKEKQRFRYNVFGNDEISNQDEFCLTYDVDADFPREGQNIQLEGCSLSDLRQRWRFDLISSNPIPDPPISRRGDLYCGDVERRNILEDNQRPPNDADYAERSCLDPKGVFESDSPLLQTYEIIDSVGIEVTIHIKSECDGVSGEDSSDAKKTLFRIYEVIEDDDGTVDGYRCMESVVTRCDSTVTRTYSFVFDGSHRYLVLASGVRVDIVECTISDGCTAGDGIDNGKANTDVGRSPDATLSVYSTDLQESVWVQRKSRKRGRRRKIKRRVYCDGVVKAKPSAWCDARIVRGKYKGKRVSDVCLVGCALWSARNK